MPATASAASRHIETEGVLARDGNQGFEGVAMHMEYVRATQPKEYRKLLSEALQRNVPGRGGEMMNYVELIERGRREAARKVN